MSRRFTKELGKKNVIVSWGTFVKYSKGNHNFLVVSDPNRDICSQYQVFANRHKYNISKKDLLFSELEREREREREREKERESPKTL